MNVFFFLLLFALRHPSFVAFVFPVPPPPMPLALAWLEHTALAWLEHMALAWLERRVPPPGLRRALTSQKYCLRSGVSVRQKRNEFYCDM